MSTSSKHARCAAALASIELVVAENLAGNARQMGAILNKRLCALKSRYPQIGSVDGKGLVTGEFADLT